jgi:hypothetical protein
MQPRVGGKGVIEEGLLKGRSFLIPAIVFVEKGVHVSGVPEYQQACLIHQKFIGSGCGDCAEEITRQEAEAKAIGLQ